MSDNLRASLLMAFAMFAFAIGDAIFKKLALDYPAGQLILISGTLGLILLMSWGLWHGKTVFQRDLLSPAVYIRNAAEVLAGLLGILALIYNPLGLHTAVSQAIPLVVIIGAVVYLRERLNAIRVGATLLGMIGVLMIIEPWSETFHRPVILSVLSVFAVALRDVVTRRLPRAITSYALLFWSHVTAVPLAIALFLILGDSWAVIPPFTLLAFCSATIIGLSGGVALTLAVRLGEASYITPFRYSRILFAFILGVLIFGEQITNGMIWGSAVLVLAGLVMLRLEGRRRKRLPI